MKTHHAINHFSGREQIALNAIKNALISRYHPLLIYYISSSNALHASRSCFDNYKVHQRWFYNCDLLVVMPDGLDLPENASEELESISKEYSRIQIFAHPISYIIQQMQTYSLFFQWVRHRGIILFERDNASKSLPEPIANMKQYRQQAERFFKEFPDYRPYGQTRLSPLPSQKYSGMRKEINQSMPDGEGISDKMMELLQRHSPEVLRNQIRTVIMGYIKSVDGNLPPDFEEVLWSMKSLAQVFNPTRQKIETHTH